MKTPKVCSPPKEAELRQELNHLRARLQEAERLLVEVWPDRPDDWEQRRDAWLKGGKQ